MWYWMLNWKGCWVLYSNPLPLQVRKLRLIEEAATCLTSLKVPGLPIAGSVVLLGIFPSSPLKKRPRSDSDIARFCS